MKIQCDVCEKDEASLFCVADEAALCAACDHRVHHANKLSVKHQRFSLHHPSPKQTPLCDICKERRAFLFCQQDRAIMCQHCDVSIHRANEHTQKHTRFLLTGVKLSAACTLYSTSAESASPDIKSATPQGGGVAAPESCDNSSISASSISEYLIETLPGWHVEDFLDSSFPSPFGFCKNGGNGDAVGMLDADLFEGNISAFGTEKLGFWVPQVPLPLNQPQNQSYHTEMAFGAVHGTKEFTSDYNMSIKSSRNWSEDSSFIVPQMSPHLNSSEGQRSLW